jgi:iron complex outermembrane receptor protein
MKETRWFWSLIFVGVAVCLLGIGLPAFAQEADETESEEASEEPPRLVAKEEIIVTATRRERRMVDVPITMSAVSAESIEVTGIREVRELAEFIPNVQVSQANDFRTFVTIRGVGTNSRNIGFDTRVGVYIDGVYVGQSPALNQELYDLERVEVLRGPQGTLFGKNTVAGAMNLVTKKPTDQFEGRVSLDVGNLGFQELKAFINTPISKGVSAKFSAVKTERDGYIENLVTGESLNERDALAYRAQFRFQPSEKLEINLSGDGLNTERLVLVGEPLTDMMAMMPDPHTGGLNGIVAFDFDPKEVRDVYGAALDIDYHWDNGNSFKSITGWRSTDINYRNTTDYQPVDIISIDYTDDYSQLTQELQFISNKDRSFDFLAGVYYFGQEANTARDVILGQQFISHWVTPLYNAGTFTPPLPPAPALPPELVSALLGFGPPGSKVFNQGTVDTTSLAAYFNATVELGRSVELGFGARYSREDKDVNWLLDGRNSGIFFIGSTGDDPTNPTPMVDDRSDDFLAPSLSLTVALGGGTNFYARYAAGFKSGGYNLDYINAAELVANPTQEFDKETVNSFDLGFKGSVWNNRLSFTAAGFYAEYEDYQVNQFVDLGGGRTSIRITNAAKVSTVGFEGDFLATIGNSVTLQGSLGLLDATFDSFPGGGAAGQDVSGNRLVFAPEVNASLSFQYWTEIPSIGSSFLIRLDGTHASDFYTTPDNVKEVPYNSPYPGMVRFGWLPERTLLHARVGLITKRQRWEFYLWGRNLTDEVDPVDGFRDFFGTIVEMPSIGRTYGLAIDFNF